jgi:hypothetical protein
MPNLEKPYTVTEGKSLVVDLRWASVAGEPEAPQAVRYQVFDFYTGEPIGEAVDATGLGAEMSLTVPASKLPGPTGTDAERRLVLQVEGNFETDVEPLLRHIHVTRRFTPLF